MRSAPLFGVSLLLAALAVTGLPARAAVPVPPATHPGAGQTFYFVLTDRFANGATDNDRGGIAGGAEAHGFDPTRISHYHGGDFAGLTAKLDYLQALGVTAVWVTPPFRNKAVQAGTAGYHGYWITDFLRIDPHLGTDEDFREFVRAAHGRGLKVYMDIIVNHTADVITLQGDHRYRDTAAAPYRDAAGKVFDARAAAYNGLGDATAFPRLAAEGSFAYRPVLSDAERGVKHPAWLNDVTLYHNRGNTTFAGENSVHGDFVGLDDLFTEHPRVVQGMIEIFSAWRRDHGVDGFRIDTAKHVNAEFWQAFIPALRAEARQAGRPDFLQFGEVASESGPEFLSEFSTGIPIDTTLDFGFFQAARSFVSQRGTAAGLADFFARDDYYTDHDGNVHATTTFLGNHDAGRFAYFLQKDNPGASPARLADLVKFGHGLLYLARGQPVVYYGDEQGMIGRGGDDMQAREDMFAAQAPAYRDAPLLATTRTGADDKFDGQHPFYRFFGRLGALRSGHAALRTGAMRPRVTAEPEVFAFSRMERSEHVEYLAVFNASRTGTRAVRVPTSQPGGAKLAPLFDATSEDAPRTAMLTAEADGAVHVTLAPLQFALWRAAAPLPAAGRAPRIALVNPAPGAVLEFTTREIDGQVFPSRQELRAEVSGGDGHGEVTFLMRRTSRPQQAELVGTDDAAPYRVFWRPPPDLAAGEKISFVAIVSDLRGRTATARVDDVTVAPSTIAFGIRGATVPVIRNSVPARTELAAGAPLVLAIQAEGTGPLEYQWLRDGAEIPGATAATLSLAAARAGSYAVLVRNRAGTAVSGATEVRVTANK